MHLPWKDGWFYNCQIHGLSSCMEHLMDVPCCCRWRTQRKSRTYVQNVAKHSLTRATWSSIAVFMRTVESWSAVCVESSCLRLLTYSVTCIFTTQSGSSCALSVAAGFPQTAICYVTSVCTAMISRSCAQCVAGRSVERLISRCTATHTRVLITRLLAYYFRWY